jgi:hypothetical protein
LEESKALCSGIYEPDDVFTCLSKYLKSKDLSKSCKAAIEGYNVCSTESSENEESKKDKTNPEGGNGEHRGDPSDNTGPGEGDGDHQEEHRGPGNAGNEGQKGPGGSGGDNENHPRGPGEDHRGPGEDREEDHRGPVGETGPSTDLDVSPTRRAQEKTKPSPKQKPGPTQSKPCWARTSLSESENENLDVHHEDIAIHSEESDSGHSSSYLGSILFLLVFIPLVLTACLMVIAGLAGALIYTRQKSNSSENLPTVKGYWRAPSIQATLYEDSCHSEDGLGYGEGVELEKMSTAIAPVKILSNFPGNSSPEVRI